MSPSHEIRHHNDSHRHQRSQNDSSRDPRKTRPSDPYHGKESSDARPRHSESHHDRRERREERDPHRHADRPQGKDRRDEHHYHSSNHQSNSLRRSNALKVPKDNKSHGGSGSRSPGPHPPRSPKPGEIFVGVVDGVRDVVKDGVRIAKKADKACDGALSDIAREVGMLALEHQAHKHRIPVPPRN